MFDPKKNKHFNKAVFPLEQYFTLRPPRGCKWMFAGVVTPDPDCPPCFLNQMLLLWTTAFAT